MTATNETTNETPQVTEPSNGPEAAQASERRTVRKLRSPKQLRLPQGVLVRVDVLEDEHGHIQAYTRERLSSGWGDERNEVASLLVRTGLDVLDGFKEEGNEGEEDDSDGDEEAGVMGPRNGSSSRPRLSPDLRMLYR